MSETSPEITGIRVRRSTKDRLASLGSKDDSYDDLLVALMDSYVAFYGETKLRTEAAAQQKLALSSKEE